MDDPVRLGDDVGPDVFRHEFILNNYYISVSFKYHPKHITALNKH